MSLLSKLTKSVGTGADSITASIEKTARVATHLSNAIEAQAARWDKASMSSLRDTLIEDRKVKAEQDAELAALGIDPKEIDDELFALLGRKQQPCCSDGGARAQCPSSVIWSSGLHQETPLMESAEIVVHQDSRERQYESRY